MGNEFWAALIGAIIGGGFTLAAQIIAISSQREEVRMREMEHVRASLNSVIIKAIRIYNQFANISQFIDECMNNEEFKGAPNPVLYVLSFINIPAKIDFSDAEVASVQYLKDDEILNKILDLPYIHASVISSLIHYNEIREVISAIEPVSVSGQVGMIAIPEDKINKWLPKIVSGNNLIFQIKSNCDGYLIKYDEIIGRTSQISRQKYKTTLVTDFAGDVELPHWTRRKR